jgi:hypothetical protein
MLPLPTNDAPRHARMFELLRQRELAMTTTERLQNRSGQQASPHFAKQFQENALRSFVAQQVTTGAQAPQPKMSAFGG